MFVCGLKIMRYNNKRVEKKTQMWPIVPALWVTRAASTASGGASRC